MDYAGFDLIRSEINKKRIVRSIPVFSQRQQLRVWMLPRWRTVCNSITWFCLLGIWTSDPPHMSHSWNLSPIMQCTLRLIF